MYNTSPVPWQDGALARRPKKDPIHEKNDEDDDVMVIGIDFGTT
jgi:hypothetical protein